MTDVSKDWPLVPYVSIGPIKFGMTPNDVSAILGEPLSTSDVSGKTKSTYRSGSVLVTYFGGMVDEVGLTPSPEIVPIVGGNRIFDDEVDAVLPSLEKVNGEVFEAYGFLIFKELGITLTGFHDGDHGDKAMSSFSKSRLERLNLDMNSISFL